MHSMNVLCLCDTITLPLHINIATAEGEIKKQLLLSGNLASFLKCTTASLVGPSESAEE